MSRILGNFDRRLFLGTFGASLFTVHGLFADQLLLPTPPMTEGPFYPNRLPLDQDNDLILVNDQITPAVGTITHLSGRVLDNHGSPVKDAKVEIWQCDANGVYLHTADSGRRSDQQDRNFQGYGQFVTDSRGEYRFRTIKPVQYPGRFAPHIHFKVSKGEQHLITTQLFVRGYTDNNRDGIFRSVRDPDALEMLLAEFKQLPDSTIGELTCRFDIVIGHTPEDADQDQTG